MTPIEMLRAVQADIRAHPLTFNMDTYRIAREGQPVRECIGGKICSMVGVQWVPDHGEAWMVPSTGEFAFDIARKALELNGLDAKHLFYVSDWLDDWRGRYDEQTSPDGRAMVADYYIEYFIGKVMTKPTNDTKEAI